MSNFRFSPRQLRLLGTVEKTLPAHQNWFPRSGLFSEAVLLVALAGRKYETGEPASWIEGDWNADGVFDSSDLIEAIAASPTAAAAVLANPAVAAAVNALFNDDPAARDASSRQASADAAPSDELLDEMIIDAAICRYIE